VPIREEISWSEDLDKHLALLAEFAALQHKLESIPEPAPRFTSHILPLLPRNTVVYASIPNLADMLAQANSILQQQMQESPVLKQWWTDTHRDKNEPSPEEIISKMQQLSGYLGDEVVFFATRDAAGRWTSPAVVADVARSGLREFIASQMNNGRNHVRVFDEQQLASATDQPGDVVVLVGSDKMVASGDLATVRAVHQRIKAGASGFESTPFGEKVLEAYSRGAGFLVAANLGAMMTPDRSQARGRDRATLERTGFTRAQYLIVERREVNGQPDNHAVLTFNGERQGIASWLAAPAPMGALNFVSSDASLVIAGVSKTPAQMFDDVMQIVATANGHMPEDLARFESESGIQLRDDLAATVGGDFALALDGPVLPMPAWKLVVEVYDPVHLQATIAKLVEAANRESTTHGGGPVTLEQQQLGSLTIHTIHWKAPIQNELDYTFIDGYLVTAPSLGLLTSTLQAHANGNTLATSERFKSLIPPDPRNNVSALLYQNLAPVLEPLRGQLTQSQLTLLNQIAADTKPTVVAAIGEPDRIEVLSTSKFFGFDLNTMTISALLGRKNAGTQATLTP
jgi:hypothetical protein